MNIFGFEIKSREEKEKEEREYLCRIFPGGLEQKKAVERELREKFPGVDARGLMLYYILVRDSMTAGDGMGFEEAVERVSKKQRIVNMTPEMLALVGEIIKKQE